MTIKEELKEQFQQAKARAMIEEFLIPKFREIAKAYPLAPYLTIKFHHIAGCWFYTSNIDDWEDKKEAQYDYEVVNKALKIAKEYDIEPYDSGKGETLCFSLKLD